MHQPDAEPGEEAPDLRQFRRDRFRRHGPARPGDADRIERAGSRKLCRARLPQEEQGAKAALGQRRERIGRAGEIVAVPAVERRAFRGHDR